ncbi:MAG: isocitrate/isopropylmalate family dehydrogenase [Pseudomonadota bacterium]
MKTDYSIAVFNGDGIGPEIMQPTLQVLQQLLQRSGQYSLTFEELPAGAAHYRDTRESLPPHSLTRAREADAILLSAMGLPSVRYDDGTEISPQIDLRKALNLFAGVRPVKVTPGQHTPLKLPCGHSIDFVLIRESTEGLFHSQGSGEVSHDSATETMKITRETSNKLFRFAFAMAEHRSNTLGRPAKVTCIDKANVFRAFAFFRELFEEQAKHHRNIEANSVYVDAAALWMVQKPWTFDVMVTENMFGDILSDLGAGLMGGLGVAPSADIGEHHAVFQPCHGSAPDIAGSNTANPLAMMLSAAMMLDWLGVQHRHQSLTNDAQALRNAVYSVIGEAKTLTRDLGGTASTTEVASVVIDALQPA